MKYHQPPLQPAGSMDCELYAGAYIAKIYGHDIPIETLREYKERERRDISWYLASELNLPLDFLYWQTPHSQRREFMWANTEGYKDWVLDHAGQGHIGFATIHLIPQLGHCVALLEADDRGVLVADSVRGLVRDSWEKHLAHDDRYFPSRVEAWFCWECR